jgi:serine/threonine protein kinase
MTQKLEITLGQYSTKGRKEVNQDFYGALFPEDHLLASKGFVAAIADGISSSGVSHVASETAISTFIADYYSTSEAWSIKNSAERVLGSVNSWLHSQTQKSQYKYDLDKGYVCTFSALIIKSNKAHIFHIGDTRVYRLLKKSLEQLTEDHRMYISQEKSYLARALGINRHLDIDYISTDISVDDIFILATDGFYEYTDFNLINDVVMKYPADLNMAAKELVEESYKKGSSDNITVQIVRIDKIQELSNNEINNQLIALPFPPALSDKVVIDGYKILRDIKLGSRSYTYLAVDEVTGVQVVIKVPSVGMRDDLAYLERFLVEEWVARRINNPHVLKLCPQTRKKNYLYVASEFIQGQSLTQWLLDYPQLDLMKFREIIGQVGKGLQAFHRIEAIHQDLKPDNIMIDNDGLVKLIDFGASRVAGVIEMNLISEDVNFLGSAQYAAPEYFLGEVGTSSSDIFSLGVIAYQMLSGKLPYGSKVPKATTIKSQKNLLYTPITSINPRVPDWVDAAIRKALQINPIERYQEVSEFIYDINKPNLALTEKKITPLIERDPVIFWKTICLVMLMALVLTNVLTHLR